jgi:hypothetical protein
VTQCKQEQDHTGEMGSSVHLALPKSDMFILLLMEVPPCDLGLGDNTQRSTLVVRESCNYTSIATITLRLAPYAYLYPPHHRPMIVLNNLSPVSRIVQRKPNLQSMKKPLNANLGRVLGDKQAKCDIVDCLTTRAALLSATAPAASLSMAFRGGGLRHKVRVTPPAKVQSVRNVAGKGTCL